MKTRISSFKMLPFPVILCLMMSLSGCYQNVTDLDLPSGETTKLSVVTRSVSGDDLDYPLTVYAFDDKGVCRTEKVVVKSGDALKFPLAEGKYRITAIAGYSGLNIPENVSFSSAVLSTQDGNFSTSPLSMGHADVIVSESSSATVQMSLQVASLEIVLTDLPDDVEAVSVQIAKHFSRINLEGEPTESAVTELACRHTDDGWTTGRVYLLPSSTESSVFSFSITDASGVQTYGYTYNSRLKAGIPYLLRGAFTTGFVINGTIVSSGWDNEVVLDFKFGPGVEESGGGENSSDGEAVEAIPTAPSLWKGHIVANVKKENDKEAELTLLSIQEWKDVWSAKKEANKDDAKNTAEAYSEDGLGGWHIPSKEEATALRDLYAGEKLLVINNFLENNGIKTLSDGVGTKNVRYLCDDAASSFSFKGNSQITEAGTSVRYLLRLTKTVKVKKR